MKVCDERSDVPQRIRMSAVFAVFLYLIVVFPGAFVPCVHVAFVDAVDPAAAWSADVFVGKKELPQARIQRETVNAVAGGINHHCARAVNEITGGDLLGTLLQTIFDTSIGGVVCDSSM